MVARLQGELKAFYSEPLGSHAYAVMPGRAGNDPTRKPSPELKSWLVDTGDVFRDEVLGLFSDRGKVLVSATLAASRKRGEEGDTRGSFRYARERLGLIEDELEAVRHAEEGEDGSPAGVNPAWDYVG